MTKTILITGSTDGIGLETAKALSQSGHNILLHGRNAAKLADAKATLEAIAGHGSVETYVADLSDMADVEALAAAVMARHDRIDVLINNAGVFAVPDPRTAAGLDIRFAVNTIAPYLLTRRLLPILDKSARVVNLSSAAQSPVDLDALAGNASLSDSAAYGQSKLALTMWSRSLAQELAPDGPMIVAVNPGSFLGTKMVREAYGSKGNDVGIGVDILVRAALSNEFADAAGLYFDNDSGQFARPHPDALDPRKCEQLMRGLDATLQNLANR
ncbi:SDR family NAD(P)-dependent oxidoreductase [Sphingorhabdus sp. YGSMI21]|uniref:SDR family NAD(P)-dependent oxidoreductase n=1 Tax=Sphingorhabdus sp. YGSMI21 TaxID=2077182 RepID=UPI000C1EB0CD|nr:SDR family NAD(P)-dependent oxidoreductase [Sphingorhabdus sp. YGSMI21]ATW05090.1 oxidoreductase [Sphingorhabdus sp. YGSMI21]